jgi:hypothetical protein
MILKRAHSMHVKIADVWNILKKNMQRRDHSGTVGIGWKKI